MVGSTFFPLIDGPYGRSTRKMDTKLKILAAAQQLVTLRRVALHEGGLTIHEALQQWGLSDKDEETLVNVLAALGGYFE